MPLRATPIAGRRCAHWWSNDLATIRLSTVKAQRAAQRSARRRDPREQTDAHSAAYTEARNALRDAIRAAQARSWAELCRAVDDDPWGLPYRVVRKKISLKQPGVEARGREDQITNHLFPAPLATDWTQETPLSDDAGHQPADPFTLEELRDACLRLPAGKATSPDGIPNEVLLRISRSVPQVLLGTFNHCLSDFPARWKTVRLG